MTNVFFDKCVFEKMNYFSNKMEISFSEPEGENISINIDNVFFLTQQGEMQKIKYVSVREETSLCLDIRHRLKISDTIKLFEVIFFYEKSMEIIPIRIVAENAKIILTKQNI